MRVKVFDKWDVKVNNHFAYLESTIDRLRGMNAHKQQLIDQLTIWLNEEHKKNNDMV